MINLEQGTKTQLAIADGGKRIELLNPQSEIRNPKSLRSQPSAFPLPRSALRPAFTLIELLVAILIIGILAAALLGVAATASESAREAKTRNIIARIHTLLMEQYDTYKSRRVKVRQTVLDTINNDTTLSAAVKGADRQQARLYALREMMLMEMPCRWSDVLLNAVPTSPNGYNDALYPIYLDPLGGASASSGSGAAGYRTPLASLYLRQYNQIANGTNKLTGTKNTQSQILTNEGAELLYMFIVNATGDGEAKSLFSESGIGDTDGDGAPEFLDGWGHPISFLRWAPGFVSDIQHDANDLPDSTGLPPTTVGSNSTWETAAKEDHDPFDLFRIEIAAFRLVPLIVSSGRDESFGIFIPSNAASDVWVGNNLSNTPFNISAPKLLTPYTMKVTDGSITAYAGSVYPVDDKSATDNIHNHLIGTR